MSKGRLSTPDKPIAPRLPASFDIDMPDARIPGSTQRSVKRSASGRLAIGAQVRPRSESLSDCRRRTAPGLGARDSVLYLSAGRAQVDVRPEGSPLREYDQRTGERQRGLA
jgi:hypothetical protein